MDNKITEYDKIMINITEYDKMMIDTINCYVTGLSNDVTEEEIKTDLESILLIVKEWLRNIEERY